MIPNDKQDASEKKKKKKNETHYGESELSCIDYGTYRIGDLRRPRRAFAVRTHEVWK